MNKKFLTLSLLGLFAIALVSAGLIYYSQFVLNVHVDNPIEVLGDGVQPIEVSSDGTTLGEPITVTNDGDNARIITFTAYGLVDGLSVEYVGKIELTTKNTETWEATEDRKENVIYTIVGEEFNAEVELESGEVLVYALDNDDRFVDYASVIKVEDIDGDLPYSEDWNSNANPDYCNMNNGFDDYENCNGAKLWVVKESDLGTAVDGVYPLSWANMNEYLYETDLIRYFDNANGQITIPADSTIVVYPQITASEYLESGDYEIKITVA